MTLKVWTNPPYLFGFRVHFRRILKQGRGTFNPRLRVADFVPLWSKELFSFYLEMPVKWLNAQRQEDLPLGYIPKYFSRNEFLMCNPSCLLEDMDEDFLRKLDKLRELCGFPLMLTCAYRSVEWDKEHGRKGTSYHCHGRAVDIYCTNSARRASILLHAPMVGLNGLGVAKTFVHVDDRAIAAVWLYD